MGRLVNASVDSSAQLTCRIAVSMGCKAQTLELLHRSLSGSSSAEAIGGVFQVLVDAAVRDAASGAFEDEEEDEGTGEWSSIKHQTSFSHLPPSLPRPDIHRHFHRDHILKVHDLSTVHSLACWVMLCSARHFCKQGILIPLCLQVGNADTTLPACS